ncbi:hypothetical protein C922_01343 [Plasmodium inui San Antonio 1]|uniref:Uncharacterized protein n=1 Tax=Plasmodium inui San Antonio 1 TaxID=1237626 RepID=W7AAL7_9APIC|nr:hypothetical protein C922_01343 [Plasmodium inui San Antonio 1]EUD68323.1 hypothetical protein C922_01343 [Plasmodium inui San Antonio 1]
MKEDRKVEEGSEKTNKNEKQREKFRDIDLKVEAYGEGDYRLLRYLPDGSCVFEQIPDEENKNMKNLQQYAQLFCSAMEKRIQIKSNDNNLRNDKEWTQGEEYRVMVEDDLKELMVLFDLILGTLNYDKGTKYLTLNKCNYVRDIKANNQDICIAVTTRKELLQKLRKLCEETRKQINSINGIVAQKYFLHFINQLIQYWKVLNKKYSEIDYLQLDNNFPYVTEVSVEYFFLPSYFWNFSSNPIFLSWPPYPSFSPFKSQYANVTFSFDGLEKDIQRGIHNQTGGCAIDDSLFRHKPNKRQSTTQEMIPPLGEEYKINDPTEGLQNRQDSFKPNGDIILNEVHTSINGEHKTNEQSYTFYYPNVKEEEIKIFSMLDSMSVISVEFEGIAAHLIEKNYAIQFDLCPLNVQLKNELKTHTKENHSAWGANTFPERIIPENIFFEQAKKMHEKLTTAQWVLIDKSIFYILAEQANNLKDRNNNLALNLPSVTGKRKKIKIHCTDINHKCLEFLISDVMIPSIGNQSIPVDFCFAVMYESTEGVHSNLAERCANGDPSRDARGDDVDDFHGDDLPGRAQVNTGGRNCQLALDYELVQLFLHLSLAKVRDLFICSWKYFSFEMPYYSADIHPLIYQNVFPDPRSGSLITSFFSWFIASMEKYLRASAGTPI